MEMHGKTLAFEKGSQHSYRYFLSALFPENMRKRLAFIGIGYKVPKERTRLLIRKLENCSEAELVKIEKSVAQMRADLQKAHEHIMGEASTPGALANTPFEAEHVRHSFMQVEQVIKQRLDFVERKIGVEFSNKEEIYDLIYTIEEHRERMGTVQG